jgi:dihydrofolate synthase / folylpolyglutamate synthase
MRIHAYKTHKIQAPEELFQILDAYLPTLKEKSIVVVTSKIISICQGNVIKQDGTIAKEELIKKEADYFYEDEKLTKFGLVIPTIKNSILIANAGIDESNADGYFILWPKKVDQTAKKIWEYLRKKNNVKELGIIITDSHLTPLRWGVHAIGITWCGFVPLKDYRGTPDIFGKPLRMEQENIVDELGNAASVTMGEGNEQTPLAVITDVPFVQFQSHIPTKKERESMLIEKEDDLYRKFLTSVKWQKGGGGRDE